MPNSYKESTYREVLCWTADTRIKYVPNPKSGKSFHRYAGYEKAATVARAMELGSFPQDLLFDYEHGLLKRVGGPKRKAPLDLKNANEKWTKIDKMLAKMHAKNLTWKKTFEIAASMGIDRRQLTSDKAGAETTEMRAKRLQAAAMATMILEDVKASKRKITDRDVTAVLRLWGFRQNTTRQNVMQEGQNFVFSDTLGLVTGYDGSVIVTSATSEYASVTQVFGGWLRDHMPSEFKDFGFSSINVNANYAAALHRDGNNEGPSFIKAFGKFTGGELNYWADDDKTEGPVERCCFPEGKTTIDISKRLLMFDGNRGHSVEDFAGERFSLVFFCVGLYNRANKAVKAELERCGITLPTEKSMAKAKIFLGSPLGSKGASTKSNAKSAARCWPVPAEKEAIGTTNFLAPDKVRQAKKAAIDQDKVPTECADKTFVGHKIQYHLLDDGRTEVRVFLVGISGGQRLAITGGELEKKGKYAYEKVEGFRLGPALKTNHIADVRAWVAKMVKKNDSKADTKRCIRSVSADECTGHLAKRLKSSRT